MNSPTQLATQIRFHLETLRETNAHHPFEQLCLGLTRRRIVSNVIPATGPVSAGGDGGRDAESFWTVLAEELPDTSLFTTLSTDDVVVLAVTAQGENVPGKIRSDLSKICGKGEPVDRVIYFTITPVDTAKRHDLQAHAREKHSVGLEIWDAQAISTELASPDLFYLAVDFLHVPSSLAPERPDAPSTLPDWYIEERDRWRSRPTYSGSMGEFVDLREVLRYSIENPEARADLPDLLATARKLRESMLSDDSVANRIDYEISLAAGLGLNSLKAVDATLRDYFHRIGTATPDVGVLVDAITLIRLVQATQPRGGTTITAEEVADWADGLEAMLDAAIAAAPGANAKAGLLAAAALLALGPSGFGSDELDRMSIVDPRMSDIYQELTAAKREGRALPSAPKDSPLRDLSRGMAHLVALLDVLPDAPMTPLDQLTTMFDLTAPALVDHPDYIAVRRALDETTVERAGQTSAGDRAQNRAIALLQAERPLDALREIHAAKLNWLNGDAAEGAAIMMLLASNVYSDLGLPIAAKQYAMSAASIARANGDPSLAVIMARGLMLAATYEHQAGQWLTATRTFRIGIWAQGQLAGDPWSFERYPYFENMLIDQCFIIRTAAGLRPTFLPGIQSVVASTGLDQLVEPMLAVAAGVEPLDEQETVDAADRAGIGRPFSDAGPVREYSWSALGNVWIVTTTNDRAHVLAAERFVAAAQITLADLAGEDLLLIPGEIRIEVEVTNTPVPLQAVFTPMSDRGPRATAHRVRLTQAGRLSADAGQLEVAGAALQVIVTHSLLGRPAVMAMMERTFERGLPHMLTCVRPYDELVDVHKDDFYGELRAHAESLLAPERPRSPAPALHLNPQLPAHAEAYDQSAALDAVSARYNMMLPPVRLTLSRLASDRTFMTLATKLRAQGWKDWHLLVAIANIVINERARHRGLDMSAAMSRAQVARFHSVMEQTETSDDPVTPMSLFTEESMWFYLASATMATAQGAGLEVRLSPFDPQAFLSVLGDRFNLWGDDVPHEPLFRD